MSESVIKALDHYIDFREKDPFVGTEYCKTIADLYTAEDLCLGKDENLKAVIAYDPSLLNTEWQDLETVKKTIISKTQFETLDKELPKKSAKDQYLEDFAKQSNGTSRTKTGSLKI